MIPTANEAKALWDKYHLPTYKQQHVELVGRVALFLARKLSKALHIYVNEKLILAGALLHDIDKNIPLLPGEAHPDTGVRILREEGMDEVAKLVKTHPLHAVLDPAIAPKTWEEKVLFLADKMVKLDIITVDKRFFLWRKELMPEEAKHILAAAYPEVKKLETEIFDRTGIRPEQVKEILGK